MTTDEWLMRTLWGIRDSDDYFGELANAATKAFSQISLDNSLKRHEFLVSGWVGSGSFETDSPPPTGFTPNAYHAFVSNFRDFDAGLKPLDSATDFSSRARPLFPPERFRVIAAGIPLTPAESSELESNVAAALRSPGGGERAAAVAMLRTVERVSNRNPAVGGGAFVCSLPRSYQAPAPPDQSPGLTVMGMQWGLPERGVPTFVHIPNRPTPIVESPGVIADPFAGRAEVVVKKGRVPDIAGVGKVPEEGELRLRLIALRSSEEIAKLFESG